MKKFLLPIVSVLLISQACFAQGDWTFSGQVRYRSELDNKDFNSATKFSAFDLLRTRFNAKYSSNDNLNAFLQFQDSRAFGEENSTMDGSANNIDLHQAYFQLTNMFDKNVDLKIGRMEVNYGSQRLVGAVGWSNIGRSFDGVSLTVRMDKLDIDVFEFVEVENRQAGNDMDRYVMGVVGKVKSVENYRIEPYFIWERQKPTEMRNRKTIGLFAVGNMDNFYHETEFSYQFGKNMDFDTGAMLFGITAGMRLTDASSKPDFHVGLDYLSGDDNPMDDKIKVFDTMFATNHKFYGFMDYFTNIPVHTMALGLMDIKLGMALSPNDKTNFAADFHIFSAAQDYTLASGSTSKAFGNEIDVTVKYAYADNVSFTGGLSMFMAGDIFKETKGEDTSIWSYISLVVNLN